MMVSLHHRVEGPSDGPVLVLGNSLGTDLAMWDRVLAALPDGVRTVRYDHRGQGSSPVPPGPYSIADLGTDLLVLLDELGIDRAAYCGVSLGGMVGLWLAANAPGRIERLIACCTSAHPAAPEMWRARATTVLAAGSTAPITDQVVSRWTTPSFAARRPDVTTELRNMLLASPPGGYAACCGVLERLDLRGDLTRVSAPTLVVAGASDEAIPPAHGERIAQAVPNARFELVASVAHIPMVERPDIVSELICDHLEAPR